VSTESGKVIQVIGPVVDVEFPPGKLPNIFNAIKIEQAGDGTDEQSSINVTMEVAQHLGENRARAVAMSSTDGLVRGMEVKDTGAPISVPVGKETLGRVVNVLGDPVDGFGPIPAKKTYSIHRPAPALERTLQLPGKINDVADTGVHTQAAGWYDQMRGVTRNEDPPSSIAVGDE